VLKTVSVWFEHAMKLYKLNPRYSWKKLAVGRIILDLEKGTYFTLNETAAAVWDGVIDGKDDGVITASLAAKYAISVEQAKADVGGTIAQLVQEGVLEARHQ
jgi:hypothetical protein